MFPIYSTRSHIWTRPAGFTATYAHITGPKMNVARDLQHQWSFIVQSNVKFCFFWKRTKKKRGRTTFWKQQSVCLPQGTRTLGVFVQKNLALRCMWALGGLLGPLFTGWSGHSGAWACREAPHGLAGKTPPTGSGQWTACDHRPDCRTTPLHRPLVRSESVWFSACGTATERMS